MRKLFLSIIGLLLLQTAIAQEWHSLSSKSDESYSTTLIKSTDESVVIDLIINGFYTDEVKTSRGTSVVLSNDGMASLVEVGQPNLISLSLPIIINDYSKMDVRVLNTSYVDYPNVELAPSRGDFPRSINPADVPYTYGDVYQNDAFFPSSQVKLNDPYIIRDFRGQNVIVTPFAYNPVTKVLRVYNKMRIEVFSTKGESANIFERRSNTIKMDSEYKNIYSSRFVNYNEAGTKYTVVEEQGDLLIICHDEYMEAMQPFVEWKKTIGRKTTMVSIAEAGGNKADNVKAYISEQYANNPELTHILIVGDYTHLKGKYLSAGDYYNDYSGYSDWWFGQLTGDDSYNELVVGRFSVESVADVTTHVNRVINYEKNINANDTWLTVGQGVSNKENSMGHNGEDDYQHIDKIREDLLTYTYTDIYRDYSNVNGVNSSASIISQHINAGVSLINYCNHGYPTGWAVFNYNNSYVNALTNDNKLPFIISVACNNGEYTYYQPCFAEAWMRATNGTTGEPTGAIGGMFSSISQPWIPPMFGQDEMNDIIIESYSDNIKRTIGGISLNGNMKLLDLSNSDAYKATYNTWHLFGDPTLLLRTDVPVDMEVTHNTEMSMNSNQFRVNAANGNGALATLTRNGEIMGTAIIENGLAKIQYEAPMELGEAMLTIVGYNKITYQSTVNIVENANEELELSVFATPDIIISGESSSLNADAYGGSYNYTYSWSPSEGLNDANIQNPTATPSETTIYTCNVNDGNSTVSASVTVMVITPPTNLIATVDDNDVTLTWTPTMENVTYNVYRGDTKIASELTETNYNDNDLSQDLYNYYVTSVYEGTESTKSEVASIIVLELKVSTFANPGFIVEGSSTMLYATATDAYGEVSYSWEPAEFLNDPYSSSTLAILNETTTFTVTATCGSQMATDTLTVKVLVHPTNLVASLDGNNVTLTWDNVEHAYYYQVMRGDYVVCSYTETPSYVDENVPDGEYCYTVKAVREVHVTEPSNEACVEIYECVPPQNITAEYYWYDGEFGALIEWDRMETSLSLTEYRIYRSKDNVNYDLIGNLVDVPSMNHFQYSDMNNKLGSHYYKVTAYYADEDCESEYGLAADSSDDYVLVEITSLNENRYENVTIYPNPAKDILYIDAKENVKEINIYNMLGVKMSTVNGQQTTIDISGYDSGLYIMNIETEYRIVTRQINIIK